MLNLFQFFALQFQIAYSTNVYSVAGREQNWNFVIWSFLQLLGVHGYPYIFFSIRFPLTHLTKKKNLKCLSFIYLECQPFPTIVTIWEKREQSKPILFQGERRPLMKNSADDNSYVHMYKTLLLVLKIKVLLR